MRDDAPALNAGHPPARRRLSVRQTAAAIGAVTALGAAQAFGQAALPAHVHGVSALDVAVDGATIEMALRAPGADIVGFEHAPETEEDTAALEAAAETLADPISLFSPSAAAGCAVETVTVSAPYLDTDDDEHGHGHGHGHDDHAHDDHGHDDHDHKEHAHGDQDHDDHGHDHGSRADGVHAEFEATYTLTCASPGAIADLDLSGYFSRFAGAERVDIRVITADAQRAVSADRASALASF